MPSPCDPTRSFHAPPFENHIEEATQQDTPQITTSVVFIDFKENLVPTKSLMKSLLSPPLLCLFSLLAIPYELKLIPKCNIIICALISVISLIFHVLRYALFSAL